MMRILLYSVFLLLTSRIFAQPTVVFNTVIPAGVLDHPVDITGAGDGSGRLFVVEKKGTIRIIVNNVVQPGYFLNIQDSVENGGERGLLGLAFHPSYPDVPYVFVNYVKKNTVISRICRFTLNPNDPNDLLETSQKILIAQPAHLNNSNHKAGDLAFGPDGYLYVTMGDGGGGGDPGENGQNINTLLAKILRLDINANVDTPPYFGYPPDNPFVGVAGDDAIWAYGVRNPWRISFDRVTGDLWIGDVGQDQWEEVDFVYGGTPGGMNFGWDCREGNHPYESTGCSGSGYTAPVFEYPHTCDPPCNTGDGSSMTGGFVYRGSIPVLYGYYVFADYGSDNVWTLKQTGFGNPPTFTFILQENAGISQVVSFGEDDNGELYALSYGGTVYSISANGTLDVGWTNIKATPSVQGNRIEWSLGNIFGVNRFEIQRSFFADFNQLVRVADIAPDPDENNYHYNDPFVNSSGCYYRVAAHLDDGSVEYSPTAHILPDSKSLPGLSYDVISNRWRISVPANWYGSDLVLYDLQGKTVYNKKIAQGPLFDVPTPQMPGCYFIIIRGDDGVWSDRIVCSSPSHP